MAYNKTNWVNGQTAINESNMNKIENELSNLDTDKVNKSGDTLSGELYFKNNNRFGAIYKTRTLDNTDYNASFGLGIYSDNQGAATIENNVGNNLVGRLEVRADGTIHNGVSGKRLVEENEIAKISGTIQLDNSVFSGGELNYEKIGSLVNLYIDALICIDPPTGTWKEITVATLPSNLRPKNFYVRSVCRADNTGKTYIINIGTNGRVYITDRGTGDLPNTAITGHISYTSG